MVIWKWTLGSVDWQTIHMPEGAKILNVRVQQGYPRLWALCNPDNHTVPRTLRTYPTGAPTPEENPGEYIGTYTLAQDALVFHVFDATPLP